MIDANGNQVSQAFEDAGFVIVERVEVRHPHFRDRTRGATRNLIALCVEVKILVPWNLAGVQQLG